MSFSHKKQQKFTSFSSTTKSATILQKHPHTSNPPCNFLHSPSPTISTAKMGCCFSTATRGKRHPQPQNDGRKPPPPESADDDRAPPPSVEQECVKEVLSETPLPNFPPDQTQKTPEEKIEKIEEVVVVVDVDVEVSRSQVSEMCSVSESFSTATTFTEKRDDEVASKPTADPAQRVTRSPAMVPRKRVYSGELAGARGRLPKPPAGRSEPSPEKKGQAAAQSRLRQQSGGYGGVRRDHGEGSGRRSRSPATRGGGGAGRGKSPVKQTGRAGGKLQNVGDVRSQTQSNKEEAQNGTVEQKIENESLENPRVSLECFIFL